jgi:succinyl-diaminopimelate desuccinylase
VTKLEGFSFGAKPHAVMGAPTLNVGTFEGGSGHQPRFPTRQASASTSAPCREWITRRSSRGCASCSARTRARHRVRPRAGVDDARRRMGAARVRDLRAGARRSAGAAHRAVHDRRGEPAEGLRGRADGDSRAGEAAMAHQTDEYCSMERIRQSVALYEAIIQDWIKK